MAFDEWLCDAQTGGVRTVKSFAASIDQDGDAVWAALSLPWSSMQAKGQIAKLKLLKRAILAAQPATSSNDGSSLQPDSPNLVKSHFVGADHFSHAMLRGLVALRPKLSGRRL